MGWGGEWRDGSELGRECGGIGKGWGKGYGGVGKSWGGSVEWVKVERIGGKGFEGIGKG